LKFKAIIHVRPKPEIRDPQGEAVAGALRTLGLSIEGVRAGKEIVVHFDAADLTAARAAVDTMGKELLANPVIEDYSADVAAA